MEDFNEGDTVSRIKHCGHTFTPSSINSWFNTHVKCPICRYDIRESSPAADEPINNTSNSENIDNPLDNLTNQITSMMNGFLTNSMGNMGVNATDGQGNVIYRFEMPVVTTPIHE